MPTPRTTIHAAVRRTPSDGRVVLAVSGGIDSMVLLDAFAAVAPERVAAVATFDHGTGPAAGAAAALVAETARGYGVAVEAGHAMLADADEARWRDARWRFLREVAARHDGAAVATAHTRDDRVETVAMRILRSAGARGLAALDAPSPGVVRPLRDVDRATIAAYAAASGVRWVEDPGNASPRHLRNRVRRDLLPALRRAWPSADRELLDVARRAAAWRADVEAFIDAHVVTTQGADGAFHVATAGLRGYDARSLAVLWPAIAARAGVRLDRRGTERLTQFTISVAAGAPAGARIQLSGAVQVEAHRGEIVIQPGERAVPRSASDVTAQTVPLDERASLGRWRFARVEVAGAADAWSAALPTAQPLTVRAWRPGDRMRLAEGGTARRVKRFLADARVRGRDREGWPVVLAGDEIVWIPGVRRSHAATDRPGRPGVLYLCERNG